MEICNIFFTGSDLWLLGICGVLATILIRHRLIVSREKRNSFNTASRKFKNIFLTELAGLYPTPTNWPEQEVLVGDILEEKFPKLEAAVTEFSDVLPFFAKARFNTAWVQYYAEYGEGYGQSYHQYMPLSCPEVIAIDGTKSSYDYTKTYKATFKKNIDHILSFVKSI